MENLYGLVPCRTSRQQAGRLRLCVPHAATVSLEFALSAEHDACNPRFSARSRDRMHGSGYGPPDVE